MSKTISVIRISILFSLLGFGTLFLLGEETDKNYLIHIIIDKTLGITAFAYAYRLYKRWNKVDPWLKAYDKMCDKVMDTPNPTQL